MLYLAALLNSQMFDYFYKDIFTGIGRRTFAQVKTVYIKKLPIVKSEIQIKTIVEKVVSYVIEIKKNMRDSLFFERLIDAIVYEIYLPKCTQGAGCEVLKHLTDLPKLKEDWSNEKKLRTIEKVLEDLSNLNHPVSIAMAKMDTIEEIRIIEGKQ